MISIYTEKGVGWGGVEGNAIISVMINDEDYDDCLMLMMMMSS